MNRTDVGKKQSATNGNYVDMSTPEQKSWASDLPRTTQQAIVLSRANNGLATIFLLDQEGALSTSQMVTEFTREGLSTGQLEDTLKTLQKAGLIIDEDSAYIITEAGAEVVDKLRNFNVRMGDKTE